MVCLAIQPTAHGKKMQFLRDQRSVSIDRNAYINIDKNTNINISKGDSAILIKFGLKLMHLSSGHLLCYSTHIHMELFIMQR